MNVLPSHSYRSAGFTQPSSHNDDELYPIAAGWHVNVISLHAYRVVGVGGVGGVGFGGVGGGGVGGTFPAQ